MYHNYLFLRVIIYYFLLYFEMQNYIHFPM